MTQVKKIQLIIQLNLKKTYLKKDLVLQYLLPTKMLFVASDVSGDDGKIVERIVARDLDIR